MSDRAPISWPSPGRLSDPRMRIVCGLTRIGDGELVAGRRRARRSPCSEAVEEDEQADARSPSPSRRRSGATPASEPQPEAAALRRLAVLGAGGSRPRAPAPGRRLVGGRGRCRPRPGRAPSAAATDRAGPVLGASCSAALAPQPGQRRLPGGLSVARATACPSRPCPGRAAPRCSGSPSFSSASRARPRLVGPGAARPAARRRLTPRLRRILRAARQPSRARLGFALVRAGSSRRAAGLARASAGSRAAGPGRRSRGVLAPSGLVRAPRRARSAGSSRRRRSAIRGERAGSSSTKFDDRAAVLGQRRHRDPLLGAVVAAADRAELHGRDAGAQERDRVRGAVAADDAARPPGVCGAGGVPQSARTKADSGSTCAGGREKVEITSAPVEPRAPRRGSRRDPARAGSARRRR